jgi:hypothetical protein
MKTQHDLGAGFTAEFHGVGLTIRGPLPDQIIDLDRDQVEKLRMIVQRIAAVKAA